MPKIVKAYICVFVSLNIKAVHLELVSDISAGVVIATLHRFIRRRGKPSTIWSDHGSNRRLKLLFLNSVHHKI